MQARPTVFLGFLFGLAVFTAWGSEDTYQPKSQVTKETWDKIQQQADISNDVEELLRKYNVAEAEACLEQLNMQKCRSDLDKKLEYYNSKLEYDDKLLQGDLGKCGSNKSCEEECTTKFERNMEVTVDNADYYIPGLKSAVLKSIKEFMDSCTQGKVVRDQDQQATKRSKDQNDQTEEPYSEPNDQWHW